MTTGRRELTSASSIRLTRRLEDLDLPVRRLWSSPSVAAEGSTVVFVAGSATIPNEVVRLDVSTGSTETLRQSAQVPVDPSHFSVPRAIEFPTENDLTAHALFYPPVKPGTRCARRTRGLRCS